MRALIQRVRWARVRVADETVGEIDHGLLVLLGVGGGDTDDDASRLAAKAVKLRIFTDADDKMNLSVAQVGGGVLVVSQFTLYADLSSGNRPGFGPAAAPIDAERLYLAFVEHLRTAGLATATGSFGADMQVELCNDGPVTVWMDTATL